LVLVGRGDSYEERAIIAELNQKREWAQLQRLAVERQRHDPDGSDWAVVDGYARLRQKDYSGATTVLSRIVQSHPEDTGAWDLLGESQRQVGQPGRAAQTLERASTVGRTSYLTFFLLGRAYRDSNRLRRAIDAYGEAVRLAPEFAPAWFELGAAQARIGESREAVQSAAVLRKLDPVLAERLDKEILGKGR
jgi:Flp pilus assembly protein TadD